MNVIALITKQICHRFVAKPNVLPGNLVGVGIRFRQQLTIRAIQIIGGLPQDRFRDALADTVVLVLCRGSIHRRTGQAVLAVIAECVGTAFYQVPSSIDTVASSTDDLNAG